MVNINTTPCGRRGRNTDVKLDTLEIGKDAVVASVASDDQALRQHILDMGLTPGTEVTMMKYAPMGDPLEIRLRGYELTLRKDDAARIELVDVHDTDTGPRANAAIGTTEHPALGEGMYSPRAAKTAVPEGAPLHFALAGNQNCGKTTLFKTIVGLEPLTSGELEVGETVKISYVDQNRSGIDPDKNLWEVVSDGLDHMMVGETEVPSRAYVASFGFKGQDQQKRAGVLSGGERNRLNLALTLKQGGNLLLLDEPTNDLDVETLSALESALLEFPGCSVVISHDRMFLDRAATHILAWEGTDENPGNWYWFEGNFDSYQKNKIERLGEEAAKPHRLHRKLTRD